MQDLWISSIFAIPHQLGCEVGYPRKNVHAPRTRNFRNFLLSKGIHPDVLHGIMMSFRNDMPSLMREHVDKDFTNMFDYSKVPVIETWIERIETIRSKNSTVPPRITFFSRWLRMYVEFLRS